MGRILSLRLISGCLAALALGFAAQSRQFAIADEFSLHAFERQQLTDVYYSEGIAAGDLNRDSHVDVVSGPYWFAGPTFTEKHEIYAAKPQPREKYADHFFAWVDDFNRDGWNDVLTAGFPGTPAYIYENPQSSGHGRPWPRHEVLDAVCNESPQLVNIVGDERPELVCSHDGFFGYATIDPQRPFDPWRFSAISDRVAPVPFGHGLGVGDVNGDARQDLLMKDGWYEQPADLAGGGRWRFHRVRFAPSGGAEMYAYDVDGDGDNDVITSLAAHEFGLVWHEQVQSGGSIDFRQHTILGDEPAHNRYGVVFSELHSVALADMDGDGLKDIVTGKTYWSHHTKSTQWDAGAVVYWLRLVRTADGIDWVPMKCDGDSGIGRQLVAHDLNGDGMLDLAAGGMKGAHVLLHRRQPASEAEWRNAQPKVQFATTKPYALAKPAAPAAKVAGAIEGEAMRVAQITRGKAATQNMAGFKSGAWSGGEQLFWSGAAIGDRLELSFSSPDDGTFDIRGALTKARDYAIVRLVLDDEPLGEAIDLFAQPGVVTTGEIALGRRKLAAGDHRLVLVVAGANDAAQKKYMVGLDYIRLVPVAPAQPAPASGSADGSRK